MKRLILLTFLVVALFGCTSKIGMQSGADIKVLENNLQNVFSETNQDVKVEVKELKSLKDTIPGFSFVEINIYNKDVLVNTDKVITNGQYFTKEMIDSKTLSSLKDELEFEFAKIETIDVSTLTLAGGNKDSKNVIIEITDFQCPYCKKANSLFKSKLNDKSDYALYIVHLPLEMHPNAQTMAQVFEAGMMMGYNFKNELFESDYIKQLESMAAEMQKKDIMLNQEAVNKLIEDVNNQIIQDFAAKTDNAEKFKALVTSDEVKRKVDASKELAESLNISATPAFYVNGKAISGYNEGLILKSINNFK